MEKGIIFDMDGTLWDSSENVARSWDKVIQKEAGGLRRITREDIKRVMGHTMTEIAQMLFPMLDLKEAGVAWQKMSTFGNMAECCIRIWKRR